MLALSQGNTLIIMDYITGKGLTIVATKHTPAQPLLWDNIMNETSFSVCTQKHTKIGKKKCLSLGWGPIMKW
jgi:hypothetical protein